MMFAPVIVMPLSCDGRRGNLAFKIEFCAGAALDRLIHGEPLYVRKPSP